MSSGEGSGETTETMLRVADAFGLAAVDVDITFTAITICCHRGMAATPITSMRLVTHRGLDLTLLAKVYRLVERIERGRGLRPSAAALDEAVTAAHPYPRWVATTGAAGLGGGARAAAGLALGGRARGRQYHRGHRRHRPVPRQEPPACVLPPGHGRVPGDRRTAALFKIGVLQEGTQPELVVAAGITVLLSGFAVVGTVQDAIGGYNVTAAGRAAEISVLSAGLLTGVVLGLKVAQRAGVTLDVAAELPQSGARIVVTIVGAGLASGFYSLNGYSPLLALLFAGAAGRGTYVLLTTVGAGPVAAAGVAATVVGLAAGLLRRGGRVPWGKVPPLVVTLAGISPLLPGLTAYRGFYELSVEGLTDGLVTITLALAIGLALAAGVTLGQFLTRPHATPMSPSDPVPRDDRTR